MLALLNNTPGYTETFDAAMVNAALFVDRIDQAGIELGGQLPLKRVIEYYYNERLQPDGRPLALSPLTPVWVESEVARYREVKGQLGNAVKLGFSQQSWVGLSSQTGYDPAYMLFSTYEQVEYTADEAISPLLVTNDYTDLENIKVHWAGLFLRRVGPRPHPLSGRAALAVMRLGEP